MADREAAVLVVSLLVLLVGCSASNDQPGSGSARQESPRRVRFTNDDPAFSPDGREIAFVKGRCAADEPSYCDETRDEIYLMSANGGRERRLTRTKRRYYYNSPTWSPDGKRIAFGRERVIDPGYHSAGSQIFVMNADGSDLRQLTSGGDLAYPTWSPDGRRIAIVGNAQAMVEPSCNIYPACLDSHVYLVNVDGTHLHTLTPDLTDARDSAWSPDGRKIAFVHWRHDHDWLYVMNADGRNRRLLIKTPDWDDGAWSPDGRKIALVSDATSQDRLYVMDKDAKHLRALTPASTDDFAPTWSPDSERIAFEQVDSAEAGHIYVVSADGSNLHQLTH
jgi:TolB protein